MDLCPSAFETPRTIALGATRASPRERRSNARLTPALADLQPLFADNALQLRVFHDDAESSRHPGGTLSEGLAAHQANPPAVLLSCDAQSGFEAFITFIAHDQPRSHVAENFSAVRSAVNNEVPYRVDFRPQTNDGEWSLCGDLLADDDLLVSLPPLPIPNASQGRLRGEIALFRLPVEPAAPHLCAPLAVGQLAPLGSLATLQRFAFARRHESPESERKRPVPARLR